MLSGIVERDGVKGLFRGLGPTLATVPTFWGFYFPAYEAAKPRVSSLLSHLDVDPSSPFHQPATHLIGAVTAGAVVTALRASGAVAGAAAAVGPSSSSHLT